MPQATGIMLTSVNEYQRTSANSLANLSYNLFGYAPAPFVYGLISQYTGGEKSKWSMGCLMYTTVFAIGLFISAIRDKLIHEELKKKLKTMRN